MPSVVHESVSPYRLTREALIRFLLRLFAKQGWTESDFDIKVDHTSRPTSHSLLTLEQMYNEAFAMKLPRRLKDVRGY